MITTNNYKIPLFMTDRYANLSLRNIASLMFDVSFAQAAVVEADLDMEKLRWIVYSWDLEIDQPIKAGDQVEVTTRSIDMKKFYAYRDFYIKRAGKTIARAYVVFLLVDIDRMRPVKISDKIMLAYGKEEASYIGRKLNYLDDFTNQKEIQIRRSDIDTNFHVNNAVYFDYVSDLIDLDSKDISYINIVYKNEIRNKDKFIGEYVEDNGEIDFRFKSSYDNTIFTYGKVIKNV